MKAFIGHDASWRDSIHAFSRCSRTANLLRCSQKFRLQLKVIRFSASRFGVNDYVGRAGDLCKAFAKDLPKQPLGAVSDNGIADLSGYRNSQPGVPDIICPPEQNKPFRMHLFSRLIKHSVVRRSHNADFVRKTLSVGINHSPSAFCALWRVSA
jgi:hypothetical protein